LALNIFSRKKHQNFNLHPQTSLATRESAAEGFSSFPFTSKGFELEYRRSYPARGGHLSIVSSEADTMLGIARRFEKSTYRS